MPCCAGLQAFGLRRMIGPTTMGKGSARHMLRRQTERGLGAVALALCVACASVPPASPRDVADANDTGRTLSPASRGEREVLQRISQLPAGTAQRVGDDTVVADAPYAAASGRTCRALRLTVSKTGKVSHRVACNGGSAWFFVPDVFGSNGQD